MLKKIFLLACGLGLTAANPIILRAAVVLSDNFSYADGSLTNVSSLKWLNHSGTLGQADVAGGKLNLTQNESEDVNALLDGQPYLTNSASTLYAKFTVNFSALPAGTGGYFAHFKDATTSGFRARVFASTNGAADGTFRLGIAAAGANPTATITKDLNLNTAYTVVVRYSVNDGASTLWLNPASESEAGAVATDVASALAITSFAFRQSLATGNGMGTLQVDDLVVATSFADAIGGPAAGVAPTIVAQPADLSVAIGASAVFNVTANGSAPLNYQWQFNGAAVAGATTSVHTIPAAQSSNAGDYRVIVSNAFGSITSRVAALTVTSPAPSTGAGLTNIAYLRTLVDPQTFAPTDTTTLYTAEGVVTTYINITTAANALFYMQDATAGIAVFVSGSTTVRPNAGDRVRVTGPLGQFNGLLEMNLVASNPAHTVTTLSTNNPLPAPKPIAFSVQNDPALAEALEGSLLMLTNVMLDVTQPNFPPASSGGNVNATNQLGEIFVVRVDARVLDITSQPKPTIPVNVIGVLGQFDTSSPYTTGYQLTPTRFADIVGGAAAPKVEFTNVLQLIRAGDAPTNTFAEHVLLPGEKITTSVHASDSSGGQLTVTTPTNGLPAGPPWTLSNVSRSSADATFTYTATAAAAGQRFVIPLHAANAQITNTATWTIYVPTATEQRVTIGEFYANPPSTNLVSYANVLSRPDQPPAQSSDDEYVELVNLSPDAVSLTGWSLSDSVQIRHRFYEAFSIGSSNAVVVYGGPLNGFAPQLDVPVIPASENAFGFGLNNSGGDSLLLRNAQSNLIARVVYTTLGTNNTMTRYPDINGAFVPQLSVSTNAATPGRQFNGKLFSEPAPSVAPSNIQVTAALEANALRLRWNAEPGRTYSVYRAANITGPFTTVTTGLSFSTNVGEFLATNLSSAKVQFYRIGTP